MSHWVPQIDQYKGPRYLAIADAIGEAVRTGKLKPLERLPTHRDLAYDLGVTVGTVSRAYAEAVRRDYVVGEVGRGTYVKPDEEPENPFHIPYDINPDMFDFSLNFPAEGDRVEMLRHGLMSVAQDQGLGALMRYQSEQGMPHHREIFAKWAGLHGVPQDSDRIILTNGVQNAMTLSLMALTKPGDVLLCEEYTYPGIRTLAAQLGLKIHGIEMDDQGLVPEKLEEAIMQTGGRVLYFMPNFQNPTSVSMGDERRKNIADIAKKQGIWLIEDDIYGFLHEDLSAYTPFAAVLPDQTFYLNGASKSVTPGLRVGFIVAPQRKVRTVSACMRLNCWMASPLNVELAARWIEDETIIKLMSWHHNEATARRAAMMDHLGGLDIVSEENSYHGWLCLPEPWTSDMFCLRAKEQNVLLLAASVFFTGKGVAQNGVRVCYGAPPNLENVTEGMRRLGDIVGDELQAFHGAV